MNSVEDWPFDSIVRELVGLLVDEDYEAVERRTGGIRLSADDLRSAVEQYGRRLSLPPGREWPQWDVVRHTASPTTAWSVNVPLWTIEDGRSDLTFELTIREDVPGVYEVEVDNLHVQ